MQQVTVVCAQYLTSIHNDLVNDADVFGFKAVVDMIRLQLDVRTDVVHKCRHDVSQNLMS